MLILTCNPSCVFIHCVFRLMFKRSQHHVTAQVFSSSSPVPVLSCSTKEWALKKELPSTNCVVACQAVGEVLAQRCQQAGITRMVYRDIPWTYRSDSVSAQLYFSQRCLIPLNSTFVLFFSTSLSCRFKLSGVQWKREESFSANQEESTLGHEAFILKFW